MLGGHHRLPNGILGLLCREHFPGLVEYAGVTGPAYTFDHYAVAPDAVDRDSQKFNKALFGYSQYTWIGWDWKKLRRSLTCLGFKPIQSHSIHMD
jgi:hypothetical protein